MVVAQVTVERSADTQFYLDHVKPVLKHRCFACHGALKQEGGLRLDTVQSIQRGGAGGPTIALGDHRSSSLFERISSQDDDLRMPQEGEPLTEGQLEAIGRWIDAGAVSPEDESPEADPKEHWAFRPISKPQIPLDDTGWARNPIDHFVANAHRIKGLIPQEPTDNWTLVRRLYIGLIGMPPTSQERSAIYFDDPQWYERLVDDLLEDPRYGERWGRHWMDIWRYSDWWGLGDQLRNSQPHVWHWRDWIIQSLNDDLPYDEMLRQMLAADEIYPGDLERIRATGFLARNYFLFNRNQWMEDTVEHVSKSLMGITMNCAKCHDHKYDPIDQTDFYRMRAFFEPYHVRLDMIPGEVDLTRDAIPRVFDGWLETPTFVFRRGEESQPEVENPIAPGVPGILAFKELEVQLLDLPPVAWQPELQPWVKGNYLAAAKLKLESAESTLRQILQQTRREDTTTDSSDDSSMRHESLLELELARAEVELARVEVARIETVGTDEAGVQAARMCRLWEARKQCLAIELKLLRAEPNAQAAIEEELNASRRLVAQLELASASEPQSEEQVESLVGAKWSATRFLNSTADDPVVPFPGQSSGRRRALADWITDPRHPLTARVAVNHLWNRLMGTPLVNSVFDFGRSGSPPTHPELLDWMAADFMEAGWSMKHLHRLLLTSATFRLSSSNREREETAQRDPDNQFWWRRNPIRMESQVVRDSILQLAGQLDFTMYGPSIPSAQQEQSHRRSLYFFHSNNERNLFLTVFDEALVKECYRRDESIVPQQALALANSRLVLQASRQIAVQCGSTTRDDDDFIYESFVTILGIQPNDDEKEASRAALRRWEAIEGGSSSQSRLFLIWSLLNHNDFVTLR